MVASCRLATAYLPEHARLSRQDQRPAGVEPLRQLCSVAGRLRSHLRQRSRAATQPIEQG
jgi:hypothetical protein